MNRFIKYGFIISFAAVLFSTAHFALAQPIEYTMLAPLPDVRTDKSGGGINTLGGYIPNLFNLIIGLSAVIAVAYIIWGGFLYITTDAIGGKQEGKEKIKNAIYGLVMVSISWLILYTINPRLLEFDLNIGSLRSSNQPGTLTAMCANCSQIMGIETKAGIGTQLKSDTLSRLVNLDSALEGTGAELVVTEAYPPTRTHQNICHQSASCVDARAVADSKVYSFVTASNNAGLRAVFEVETDQRKTQIINASCGLNQTCRTQLGSSISVLKPRADGTRQITAEHFSIYNCNIDPTSCR